MIPFDLLTEIANYNRIACLLAVPELVTCEKYGEREDHREFLDCILSLKEPEKKIATQNELFRIGIEKMHEEVHKFSLFYIIHNSESTVGNTVKMLEEHFGSSGEDAAKTL